MVVLNRVVVAWAGPQVVGAAVNVLHYSSAGAAVPDVAAIRAAYATMVAALPSGVTITVPGEGDQIDSSNGALVGVWSATAPAVVTGTGAAQAPAGVGACIGWTTGGIVNARKLRGRTFIVPLPGPAYDGDGTIGAGALSTLNSLKDGLLAAGPLAIWHRPTTVGGVDGSAFEVVSGRVRDKVAFLSSRRD